MLRVIEEAHRTHTGRQRHANEDAYYARAPVFAVADGMGGAQAGEVAAQVATEALDALERRDESPERYLRRVVQAANERIHELARRDASRSGMGTTFTGALLTGEEISFAHVGDSRAYVLRDGRLKRLTSDHSLVEELRRQGRLTEEQAEDHPQRSIITRALGPEPDVEIDTMSFPARPGDVFLLCSDGLTTMVPEGRIAEILSGARELDSAARRLIDEANQAGGRDNVTVVAFRLEGVPEPEAAEAATLIGPSAEEAGLTPEAVTAARERRAAVPPGAGRRRWPRRVLAVTAGILVIAVVTAAAILGARQIYFLGTDEGGRLALYRGVPYELPFEIDLYDRRYASPVQVSSLPADRRDSVRGHELRSRDDAVSLIRDLERSASGPQPAAGPNRGAEGRSRREGRG